MTAIRDLNVIHKLLCSESVDLPCFSSLISAVSTFTSTIDVRADRFVCFRLMNSPKTRIPSVTARFSSGPGVGDNDDCGFHTNFLAISSVL
jgi:hypothetical protein